MGRHRERPIRNWPGRTSRTVNASASPASHLITICVGLLALTLLTACSRTTRVGTHVVRDAWLTKTRPPQGELGNREPRAANPVETHEFSTADREVILFVVFGSTNAHTGRASIKDESGVVRVDRKLQVQGTTRDLLWRTAWWSFPMSTFRPGRWTVDLTIDDIPYGTLTFNVR